MSERCSPIEELERIAALPADDPRRRHLDGCPRCRALLHACRTFAREPEGELAAQAGRLDARLAAALDREILGAHARVDAAGVEEPRPSFLRALGGLRRAPRAWQALRIAAACAAVVLVVLGVQQTRHPRLPEGGDVVLRGAGPAEPGAPAGQARLLADGWVFSWSPVEEADSYRLTLYDEDAVEIAAFLAPGSDTSLTIAFANLPAAAGDATARFWRVTALRSADEVARGRLRTLPPR